MNKKKVVILIVVAFLLGAAIGVVATLGIRGNLSGTIASPVGLSQEEAEKIAEELGEDKHMGSWSTMSGEQYMDWWRAANGIEN